MGGLSSGCGVSPSGAPGGGYHVRVEGSIRLVTPQEELDSQLIDFNQVTVTHPPSVHQHHNGTRVNEHLSAAERLRRLEADIADKVEARRRLLRRAAEEGDLLFGDEGETDESMSDLLTLICRLELKEAKTAHDDEDEKDGARSALLSRAIRHLQSLQRQEISAAVNGTSTGKKQAAKQSATAPGSSAALDDQPQQAALDSARSGS